MSHERYKLKTFQVHGVWCDESSFNSGFNIDSGTVMKAVGYLNRNSDIIIWQLIHLVIEAGAPITIGTLGNSAGMTFFGCIDPKWEVFVCEAYPEMRLKEETTGESVPDVPKQALVASRKHIPEYPNTCPRCGSPAVIMFRSIICRRGCDDPTLKKGQ